MHRARRVVGAQDVGANRTDRIHATATGTDAMNRAADEPLSPTPNAHRGTSMKIAPKNNDAALTAVATEFMVSTCSRGTTCGSAADSPEVTNRVKPLTTKAPSRIHGAPAWNASRNATVMMNSTRARFAPISTRRRSHRSSNAPANGPSNE